MRCQLSRLLASAPHTKFFLFNLFESVCFFLEICVFNFLLSFVGRFHWDTSELGLDMPVGRRGVGLVLEYFAF